MRVLVDTNILLRSAQPSHPHSSYATLAVSRMLKENDTVCFCPQTIAEFWNVATRPAVVNGLGLSDEEVRVEIETIERLLILLPEVPAIYPEWKRLIKDHRVRGVKVFDARLAAIANVYETPTILTFNAADFKRYSTITALDPMTLVS